MEIPSYGPFRENFYEGDPWHLKPFMEGERLTTPYDHESVVLYTGVNKHIFFEENAEDRPGDSRNPKSVLNQGVLKQGNFMRGNKVKRGIHAEGIFFGFLQVTEFYATRHSNDLSVGGAVLEIEVPVNRLTTIIPPHPKGFRNKEELSSEFESLKEFREECLRFEGKEGLHWVYKGSVPIHNITGVWDVENSNSVEFVPRKDFLSNLNRQYNDQMPSNTKYSKYDREEAIKQVLEEINEYKVILDRIGNCQEKFESIENWILKMHKRGSSERDIADLVQNYNDERKELELILREDFGIEVSNTSKIGVNSIQKNAGKVEDTILEARSEAEKAINEEEKHAQEKNWNKKKIMKENKFESKIESKLAENILKIPYIEES